MKSKLAIALGSVFLLVAASCTNPVSPMPDAQTPVPEEESPNPDEGNPIDPGDDEPRTMEDYMPGTWSYSAVYDREIIKYVFSVSEDLESVTILDIRISGESVNLDATKANRTDIDPQQNFRYIYRITGFDDYGFWVSYFEILDADEDSITVSPMYGEDFVADRISDIT